MCDYNYKKINEPLLIWYEKNKRELPWRSDPNPYYVWISEIMLQQTRVEAVREYFQRFVRELPGVSALAAVEEERLYKLWEGLGYYRRAANLKKAAELVMKEYKGQLPKSFEELKKLPGIGDYTAGAIASIAFEIPTPAVDGNVLRVAKRLAASYDDITREKIKRGLFETLLLTMPKDQPGAYNQALMDLGAMVCIPNGQPLCQECPLFEICEGRKQGIASELPIKPKKKARRQEEKTVLILEFQGRYAIHKRMAKGLLEGLWELPNLLGKMTVDQMDRWLVEHEVQDYRMELLGEACHKFSHIEWNMLGYWVKIDGACSLEKHFPDFIWVENTDLANEYALPSAFAAYRSRLEELLEEKS